MTDSIDYAIEQDVITADYLVELIHRDRGIQKHLIVPLLRETLGVSDSKWAEFKNARIYSFKIASLKKLDKIQIEYGIKNSEGEWVVRKESHTESGRTELYAALNDLIPFALSTLELSNDRDSEDVKLIGAIFKYADDEEETLSVSLLLQTQTSLEEPLNMPPTPQRFEHPPGGGLDDTKCFDLDTARLCDRLINEIRRYLAGERL